MGMHVAPSTYLNGHGAIGTDIQVTQRRAGKVGDVLDGVLVQAQLPQVPVLGQRAAWDEVDDVVLEPQPLQARAAAVRQTSGIRHKVQSPRPPHNHRAANALLQASEALDAVVVQLELAKVAQGVEAVDGDDRVVRQVDSAKLWVLWKASQQNSLGQTHHPQPHPTADRAHVPCAGPLLPVCSYHGSPTHTHWSSGPQTVPPAMAISPCAQVSQRSRRQHTHPRHNGAAAPTHQELGRHRDACRSLLALVAFPTASCATTICAVTVTVGGATAGAATTPALPRTAPRP